MGDTGILAVGGLGLECSLKSICKSLPRFHSVCHGAHSPLCFLQQENPSFLLSFIVGGVKSAGTMRCLLRGPGIGRPSMEHGILGCWSFWTMEKYCFLGAGALPCFLLQVPIDLCNQREFRGLLEGAPCLGYKDKRRNSSYHPLSMNTPHLIKWG